MGNNKQICRLCLEIMPAEDVEAIEESRKKILEVLLINIDLNITDNAVACNKCLKELQHCFHFKTSCFYVGDDIAPFVDADVKVDTKRVFHREYGDKAHVILENVPICRLCMSLLEDNIALNDNSDVIYTIEKCLPEVDFTTVDELLICKGCLIGMKRLNDFMTTCQDVEQRIQNYYQDVGVPGKLTFHDLLKFKNYDGISVTIKEEFDATIMKCPKDEEIVNIECEEVHIKEELDIDGLANPNNKEKKFKCHYCDYKCITRTVLKKHISSIHKNVNAEDKIDFKCFCGYQSKRKCDINRHMSVIHGENTPNITKPLQCHYCEYKSRHRDCLSNHISAKHERESATVHQCPQCTFKSIHASNLRKHLRLHGEQRPYKCPCCDRGFCKGSTLDNHLLRNHEDFHHLITRKIHGCELCSYKSISSESLQDHTSSAHANSPPSSTTQIFYCDNCDFSVSTKAALRQHLLVHHSNSIQCPSCKKEFSRKLLLDAHMLTNHKENAKSITCKIYECTLCSYETVFKANLSRHTKRNHE